MIIYSTDDKLWNAAHTYFIKNHNKFNKVNKVNNFNNWSWATLVIEHIVDSY